MKLFFGKTNFKVEKPIKWFIVSFPDMEQKLTCIPKTGRPWFFQIYKILCDRKRGIIWDSQVPHADPINEPPKVKVLWRPTIKEQYVGYGTNWYNQVSDSLLKTENPPPYSE